MGGIGQIKGDVVGGLIIGIIEELWQEYLQIE